MKMSVAAASLAFLLCFSASSALSAKDDHPIAGVISLLEDLEAKVENEGKEERETYRKFEYWCSTTTKELDEAIANEKDTIDILHDKIDSKEKEAKGLEEAIAELQSEQTEMEQAQAAADQARAQANALYVQKMDNDEKSIEGVSAALDLIKKSQYKEGEALVEVERQVRQTLALLQIDGSEQDEEDDVEEGRPKLKASGDHSKHIVKYKSKTDSVIESLYQRLKDLRQKFREKKFEAEMEETEQLNQHNVQSISRTNLMKRNKALQAEKGNLLNQAHQDIAQLNQDLANTEADLKADTDSLTDTTKTCTVKAGEWKERSEVREQEREAMKAAIKILAEVGGVRTDAPSNPIPPASPVFFLQVSKSEDPKMKALNLLRQEASLHHSKSLERIVQQFSTHLNSPFDKLTQMMQKMIFRLMSEQKDEDQHKAWCDSEMSQSHTSKEDKEDHIKELSLKIENLKGKVQTLTMEIAEAEKFVQDINTHVEEATEIREIGKKENAEAIKDSQDAQKAISNAIAVLESHYKESGQIAKQPWEFIQLKAPVQLSDNPSTWDSSYTGTSDPEQQPNGIISVLDKTSADFAKMEADTHAQEEADENFYQQDMQACKIEKARRSQESETKNQEKKRLVDKMNSALTAEKNTQKELDAVVQYLKDLEPACVNGDSSYEDRKAARNDELKALQEAQGILESAFRQKESKSFLQRD